MKTTLLRAVEEALTPFNQYFEGELLLRNKIIDDLRSYKQGLIEALLENDMVREVYGVPIKNHYVFKMDEFIEMLRSKTFWADSYTKYSNEIGLTSENKYLKYNGDVVLDFPHKDGVLEGGMTKEDQGKKEIYYHNIIARDEIDTLLAPKVFSNVKKYDENGEHNINGISEEDNFIVKGNNLIALHSLKQRYAGKTKLIYIDPPYNTGGDSFKYNDKFNHSTWLTFMKNRLEVARELLSDDGSIWITLDDVELHYFKVLCDEVFGRECFVNTIVWRHSDNSNNNALTFSEDHNYILVYSKSPNWKPNFLNDPEKRKHFKNPDNDPDGPWFDGNPVNNPALRPNLQFNITTPNGNVITHPANGWRWSKKTMDEKFETGELRFSDDETRVIRRTYLKDMEGLPPSTLWTNLEVTGHTRKAKYELKRLFPDVPVTSLFSTPKPELLIKYIIDISTNDGDLVMDFVMGSATTQAVAMKMKRQFIGVEQMDYIDEFIIKRLQKVIEGEQGGISELVEWKGGGSFIYAELSPLNINFVDEAKSIKSETEFINLIERIKEKALLNFKVELDKLKTEDTSFQSLTLEEKKQTLIDVIDHNLLYINYSEIEDEEFKIDERTKAFNQSFYEEGGQE
ncbi:site-specific DNA-methyltransferase [Halobacillus sp. BAB-2008]|uniref:site-specific DNA-methyltransferase n=1 Tax=Halobacillus sp. BAB-2008 TaxID=1246484 RepID=UPI0002A50BB5|nr:site-specific DNA-methyltransferase [Halobacillus sp. BAB-2008]ELK46165.1 hypothetical protein D479_11683 [Halobacillus sp. BAB-2008]